MVAGRFPTEWKEARVVLVEKPKKNPTAEVTYRPLCLINALAKLYEQVLVARIEQDIRGEVTCHPSNMAFGRVGPRST